MRSNGAWVLGWCSLVAAGLWKPTARIGGVVARLGPLPDLTTADVVTVPLAAVGLGLLVAAEPRRPLATRLAGAGLLVGAVLWVASDLPIDDPVVPGINIDGHGLHVLDVLAVAPAVLAWRWLRPLPRCTTSVA